MLIECTLPESVCVLSVPVMPLIPWLMWQDLLTKSLQLLVIQSDAPSSIMRFGASDSNVAHCIRGMALENLGLLIRLTFCPVKCVVYATTLSISDICRFHFLRTLFCSGGDCLLLFVTSNPCMKMSTCFHTHCPTGISGRIKHCSL